MGSKSSLIDHDSTWRVEQPFRDHIHGNPSLLIHKVQNFQADMYTVYSQGDLSFYQNQLQLINTSKLPQILKIIQICQTNPERESMLLCGDKSLTRVITEKITARYNQIKLEGADEMILVFYQCLVGFQGVTDGIGIFFKVKEDMIGFDQAGRTRVWLNSHFGKVTVQEGNQLHDQSSMIDSLRRIFHEVVMKYHLGSMYTFEGLIRATKSLLNGMDVARIHSVIEYRVKECLLPTKITKMTNNTKDCIKYDKITGCKPSNKENKNMTSFQYHHHGTSYTKGNNTQLTSFPQEIIPQTFKDKKDERLGPVRGYNGSECIHRVNNFNGNMHLY